MPPEDNVSPETTTKSQGLVMTRIEVASVSERESDDKDQPSHSNLCCNACTPHHSFPCRILYFILLFGLDLADFVSDWLLYVDVSMVREGLVYGPLEKSVVFALLAFSIVGTLTFIFESVNLWWEVFRNNPWLDSDLVSAVIIWIEDLPQIAINVYIAVCREDPISVFQLSKASIVLIALLIRIIISLVKYCNKAALREAKEKTTESRLHVVYRAFIMIGLFINAACAISVFLFTQTQRDADGRIQFNVPQTFFENQYDDRRYFQNVSVYFHHPIFDVNSNPGNNFRVKWIRLMSINDIRLKPDLDISYMFVYETVGSVTNVGIWIKNDDKGKIGPSKWSVPECYSINQATGDLTNNSCNNVFTTANTTIFTTFSYTSPEKVFRRYIFGDITFNMKILTNGICKVYDNFTDSIDKNAQIPTIHYYRANSTLNTDAFHHVLMAVGQPPRFYRNDGIDLEDTTKVWKTGWGECQGSGSMAPNLDRGINMDCSTASI